MARTGRPVTMSRRSSQRSIPRSSTSSSWYDDFLSGSPARVHRHPRARARSAACREAQRLIVGPWMHGAPNLGQRHVGDLDFGPEAAFDLHGWRLRWYDHWLKGAENGVMDGPPVRVFLMGTNRWLGLQEWPPAGVTYRPLHLAGSAASGEGRLTFDAPPPDDAPDTFTYDRPSRSRATITGLADRAGRLPLDRGPGAGLHFGAARPRICTSSGRSRRCCTRRHQHRTRTGWSASATSGRTAARSCVRWHPAGPLPRVDERPALLEPRPGLPFEVELRATAQTFQAGHGCASMSPAATSPATTAT